jgi:conjugative relaxase-like TrwC/TraI family protein
MLTIRAMSNGRGYAANHWCTATTTRKGSAWWASGEVVVPWSSVSSARSRSGSLRRFVRAFTPKRARGCGPGRARTALSAPKSVSIVAALGADDRLVEAHHRAVEVALQELEASAAARVRMAGANENRVTGNLVLAVYHHDTSRELDPRLHTHAVAGNLTYDGTEGRWKALQASDIYAQRAYLTEVYRNTLAYEVRALGYDVDDRHDRRGRDLGFEIRGVSQDLRRTYSQRSQQRDQAIEAFTEQTAAARPITKWPSSSGTPARTN